jgi:neural Wiskott-Aldrich syndrome protein
MRKMFTRALALAVGVGLLATPAMAQGPAGVPGPVLPNPATVAPPPVIVVPGPVLLRRGGAPVPPGFTLPEPGMVHPFPGFLPPSPGVRQPGLEDFLRVPPGADGQFRLPGFTTAPGTPSPFGGFVIVPVPPQPGAAIPPPPLTVPSLGLGPTLGPPPPLTVPSQGLGTTVGPPPPLTVPTQ